MKVVNVTPISGENVEISGEEFTDYERYGADCWYVHMGESLEPVYDCEELEKAYQEFSKQDNNLR